VNWTLSQVRRHLGRTQVDVANSMHTTQSGVSRLERQDDVLISTLSAYAEALGGRLTVSIVVDGQSFFVAFDGAA
jgi:transcriptional regulator with XRE-family HTH domain